MSEVSYWAIDGFIDISRALCSMQLVTVDKDDYLDLLLLLIV
jgi:hypothetical protein